MHKHTNRLSKETSPYLLQHAHNPVDWYPWGEEALTRARQENKPILVSIGYAACHWCHVMEKESFEDDSTAGVMNEHFINIKIDREERPDLDHIYMDAVQAMTGSGGWPLNVFLTPDAKPFYGGTYFPPMRAYNRPSWKETLQAVSDAFQAKRDEINAQAENLTEHLKQSNSFGLQQPGGQGESFSAGKAHEAFEHLMKAADREWGGFGRAPKFPQTFSIQFLLRYHYACTQQQSDAFINADTDDTGLQQALLSLDKMIDGGLYDQVGGGFARYSTDTEWLAPHFEKMLYDNALLVSVLSEAYQLTKKKRYRDVIAETIGFIEREMLHPQWGFYAALDADSEGEEGKFYVWDKKEVEELLGKDAPVFCHYYDITEKGNWEEKNILRVKKHAAEFARENQVVPEELERILKEGRSRLLEKRKERVRPALDDKIILGWNALMNAACSQAFAATGDEKYRELALRNMDFLLSRLKKDDSGAFYHSWKNDKPGVPAFLDDYAFLIKAMLHLYEITGDTSWLKQAEKLTGFVIRHFREEETGYFFYTPDGQEDVIFRKKEMYDGAVPSGNAVMAGNLYTLAVYFDRAEWKERAFTMIAAIEKAISRYPTSFGWWNCVMLEVVAGTLEIAVVGEDRLSKIHRELLSHYIPHRVLMVSAAENEEFALLAQKKAHSPPAIYVCRNFACAQPVHSVEAVLSLINKA